jgi:hypothetical protein
MRRHSTIRLLLGPLLLLFSSTALMVREHFASASAEGETLVPKTGCWGTCGGQRGPRPLSMEVASGKVLRFVFAEKCLGESVLENIAYPNSIVLPAGGSGALPISRQRFSFAGKTHISINSGPPGQDVSVDLSAKFSSATTASGALTVKHPGCEPVHFTTHYSAR